MKIDRQFWRKLFSPKHWYRHIMWRITKKQKQQNLRSNGEETVKMLQALLEETNVPFFFDMGTLLGIIREKHLLAHDMDIDVAVLAENEELPDQLSRYLSANGCIHYCTYSLKDGGVVEDSYLYNGIKFDINYYRRENGRDICYLMYREPDRQYEAGELSVVKLSVPSISGIQTVGFAGGQINVPTKAEAYLAARYGVNWRIPDKNYLYWKGPSTEPTELMGIQQIHSRKK